MEHTQEELLEAKRQINSTIHKLRETVKTLMAKEDLNRYKSQITLAQRRITSFEIAVDLIEKELVSFDIVKKEPIEWKQTEIEMLVSNVDKLHTTDLGAKRIKRNLSLETDDVVAWCKHRIQHPNAILGKRGKNWYVKADGCEITVNATSFTIITAHKDK